MRGERERGREKCRSISKKLKKLKASIYISFIGIVASKSQLLLNNARVAVENETKNEKKKKKTFSRCCCLN